MATISLNNLAPETANVVPTTTKPVTQAISSWGMGNFLNWTQKDIAASGATTTVTYIYRGRLTGEYVYSTGTPPGGATDIVVIGQSE